MPNVMAAAQPNIGGAVCESSVIPFLLPRHKVWLTAAARVPCSNGANIGERRTWTQSETCSWQNSVLGQEPSKCIVYSSPGDGQTFCKILLTSIERRRCSKTRNRLKFAGVAQTHQQISAVSGSKFTIVWKHLKEILLFNKFYPIVNKCLSCEYMARQSCTIVRRWRIFGDFFASCISSESRAPHFRPAF